MLFSPSHNNIIFHFGLYQFGRISLARQTGQSVCSWCYWLWLRYPPKMLFSMTATNLYSIRKIIIKPIGRGYSIGKISVQAGLPTLKACMLTYLIRSWRNTNAKYNVRDEKKKYVSDFYMRIAGEVILINTQTSISPIHKYVRLNVLITLYTQRYCNSIMRALNAKWL